MATTLLRRGGWSLLVSGLVFSGFLLGATPDHWPYQGGLPAQAKKDMEIGRLSAWLMAHTENREQYPEKQARLQALMPNREAYQREREAVIRHTRIVNGGIAAGPIIVSLMLLWVGRSNRDHRNGVDERT